MPTSDILLNWLPFENPAAGAAKRSIELHNRLASRLRINAVVTTAFPDEYSSGICLLPLKHTRTKVIRFQECRPQFWYAQGSFRIFSTDTLPVPTFSGSVKTVLTVHDLRFLANKKYLRLQRYFFLKFFMGIGIRKADAVVTVSHWMAEQIASTYKIPSEKIHVIPNAAASLPQVEYVPTQPYLLTVGHLEARKDHTTILKAFARIVDTWPGTLIITGTDKMKGEISRLASELGVSQKVTFTGRVDDFELARLYAGCTALICASTYEGFGMTLLEGLNAGVPVIASNIPAHREVGGNQVHWFIPGDDEKLAEKIRLTLTLPHGGHAEKNDSSAARHNYNWNDSADLLNNVYQSLL